MVIVVLSALYRVVNDLSSFLAANQLTAYQSFLQPYADVVRAINQGQFIQRLQPG